MLNIQSMSLGVLTLFFTLFVCPAAQALQTGMPDEKYFTTDSQRETRSQSDQVILDDLDGLSEQGKEGWVVLEIVIAEDGGVERATIVESHPPGVFDERAMRQVQNRIYEPAIVNGQPSRRTTREIITFQLQKSVGGPEMLRLRTKFRKQLDRANTALSKGDYDEAAAIAEEMEESFAPSLYEQFYIMHLKANIANGKGEIGDAILYTQRAIDISTNLLDRPTRAELYKSLFALQLKAGRIPEAMLTFETLWQLGTLSPDDPYAQTYAMLKGLMESNKPMVYTEELSNACHSCEETKGMSTHVLYRDTFHLELTSGEIDRLEVSCDYNWQEHNFENEMTIFSDPAYGQCKVNVYGEKNAGYKLTETWANSAEHSQR
ncbi:MAG: energy transducer TonB [Alphaproteobacteria bacterium]|nr:MAG: energy transducer TonB [Alphaproteobacteria bacterium]